jgi:hypothetical protein
MSEYDDELRAIVARCILCATDRELTIEEMSRFVDPLQRFIARREKAAREAGLIEGRKQIWDTVLEKWPDLVPQSEEVWMIHPRGFVPLLIKRLLRSREKAARVKALEEVRQILDGEGMLGHAGRGWIDELIDKEKA